MITHLFLTYEHLKNYLKIIIQKSENEVKRTNLIQLTNLNEIITGCERTDWA
jgi:hypothetical protein